MGQIHPEPQGASGAAGDGPLLLLVRAVTLQTRTVSNNALWSVLASRGNTWESHLPVPNTTCFCHVSTAELALDREDTGANSSFGSKGMKGYFVL